VSAQSDCREAAGRAQPTQAIVRANPNESASNARLQGPPHCGADSHKCGEKLRTLDAPVDAASALTS
jgi:hypothetical protein